MAMNANKHGGDGRLPYFKIGSRASLEIYSKTAQNGPGYSFSNASVKTVRKAVREKIKRHCKSIDFCGSQNTHNPGGSSFTSYSKRMFKTWTSRTSSSAERHQQPNRKDWKHDRGLNDWAEDLWSLLVMVTGSFEELWSSKLVQQKVNFWRIHLHSISVYSVTDKSFDSFLSTSFKTLFTFSRLNCRSFRK